MKDFFNQKLLEIPVNEDGDLQLFILTPLKVKHIPQLLRLMEVYANVKEGETDVEKLAEIEEVALPLFAELIIATLSPASPYDEIKSSKELKLNVFKGILSQFIDLNFKDEKKKGSNKAEGDEKQSSFAEIIDMLISQGHKYSDIQEYTLPQLNLLCDALINRLTPEDKKPKRTSVEEVFSKFAAVSYR
jgi:hypothetical protein